MFSITIAFLFAILMALNIVLLSYLATRLQLLSILFYENIIGLFLSFSLATLYSDYSLVRNIDINGSKFFILSGFFSIGLTNYFSLKHIRQVGPEKNSLIAPLVTFSSILLSIFILNEKIPFEKILIAILLILLILSTQYETNINSIIKGNIRGALISILLVVCILLGIFFTRIEITTTLLNPYEILFLRYLGSTPFILYLFYQRKYKIHFANHKLLVIFCLSILLSFGIGLLWIEGNKLFTNFQFQLLISTVPVFVTAISYFSNNNFKLYYYLLLLLIIAGTFYILK